MELKPADSMSRDESRDLVRVHAKMFAFLRYKRTHPGCLEEDAHVHAERHWRAHRQTAIDYLSVKLAIAEKEAAPWN